MLFSNVQSFYIKRSIIPCRWFPCIYDFHCIMSYLITLSIIKGSLLMAKSSNHSLPCYDIKVEQAAGIVYLLISPDTWIWFNLIDNCNETHTYLLYKEREWRMTTQHTNFICVLTHTMENIVSKILEWDHYSRGMYLIIPHMYLVCQMITAMKPT